MKNSERGCYGDFESKKLRSRLDVSTSQQSGIGVKKNLCGPTRANSESQSRLSGSSTLESVARQARDRRPTPVLKPTSQVHSAARLGKGVRKGMS